MSTAGAELATAGMPWCSATHRRLYPSSSATTASLVVSASARAGVEPVATVASSRTESDTMHRVTPGAVRPFPGGVARWATPLRPRRLPAEELRLAGATPGDRDAVAAHRGHEPGDREEDRQRREAPRHCGALEHERAERGRQEQPQHDSRVEHEDGGPEQRDPDKEPSNAWSREQLCAHRAEIGGEPLGERPSQYG